ncbi:MAG TPA: potassium transporter Kup [Stellaceae bacterium]|jgi:KUP system potassium uptake protein|nr:potassium transporter Kup [Stellaceae bacterium]
MANRAGDTATSTEVIPAGHAALTATDELGEKAPDRSTGLAALSLAALGVVFGDIGTSPVYTFRECFNPEHGLLLDAEHVLGVLSLIFWALIIVVTVKYVLLIMRADNQGEGGILALLALALKNAQSERSSNFLVLLAIGGAALFYGDSMITPAISVLSAVEGIGVATPALNRFVLPVTVIVLLALFLLQKGGTGRVGRIFGPVMVLWFSAIAIIGVMQIAETPRVLGALNPAHAAHIFIETPVAGFVVLGAVALAITGGEALYADMGHFGRFPIRLAWFAVVLPALVLNYFGQGALILGDKTAIDNPFFRLAPAWGLYPLVLLSTAATVIASQAVISGAFSLSRQAIQLGLMPPLDIFQTSTRTHGQIYIAQINWLLLFAVVALVLGFQSSSALASAYGLAVTGTMAITTVLAATVMRGVWRWQWPTIAIVLVPIMTVDLALFGANTLKIPSGGWFPLVIGIAVFTILTTWRTGRRLVRMRLASEAVPLASFLATCDEAAEARVSGTAVFLTNQTQDVPLTLLRNLKHNKVLHRTVLLVRVVTENIPRVAGADRIKARELGKGFWQIEAHFGFAQTPNVARELQRAEIPGLVLDPSEISFFVGRANVKPSPRAGMALWRERLYSALARIATRSPDFFRIPPDRVIELGTEVEI